jgi:hypothetical protein
VGAIPSGSEGLVASALHLHSGPGWREPGAIWGNDREDDREVSTTVQ